MDEYDDLMVSNIELKEDDFDKKSFSILAKWDKKERFFEYNERALKTMKEYEEMKAS